MIRVDVRERPIETDRPFVERDQCAHVKCVHLGNAHRHRFASTFVECRARSAEKSLQIIAAGNSLFYFEPSSTSIFTHLNEGDEKIQNTVAQLLHISVLIGRAFVSVNRDALMDDISVEIL